LRKKPAPFTAKKFEIKWTSTERFKMRPAKGIFLVLLFAVSALCAASASADVIRSESYPTTLTGSKDGAFTDELSLTAGTARCTPSYQATLSADASTVAASPSYTGCSSFGFPSTIDVNGCTYLFHVNGGASTEGDADLVCPAGAEVTITAVSAGTTKCTVHFPSQADIGGTVTYSTIGAGATREITIAANLTGLDYTHTKGTGLGACTAGSATSGTLTLKAVMTGEIEGGSTHLGVFLV
jgi:hypothetical protein